MCRLDDHDGGLHQRGRRDNSVSSSACGNDYRDRADKETDQSLRADRNRSGRVIRRLVHRPIFRPPFNRLCTDADAGTNLTMDLRNALSETSKAVARRIAQIIVGRHSIGGRAGPCKTRL